MLSETEQRRLAEIEWSLFMEDPAFVHRFATGSRRDRYADWSLVCWAGLVVSPVITGVAAACGNLAGAVLGLALAVCSLIAWLIVGRRARGGGSGDVLP